MAFSSAKNIVHACLRKYSSCLRTAISVVVIKVSGSFRKLTECFGNPSETVESFCKQLTLATAVRKFLKIFG